MQRQRTFRYVVGEQLPGTTYRYDRWIGRGGMAEVLEVTDTGVGRRYACKHVAFDLRDREDVRQRFIAEALVLGKLHRHDNIVEVSLRGRFFDEYCLDYMIQELLHGPSARQELELNGPFSPFEAVQTITRVLSALDHAHGKGVVHRDVKPENIVLHKNEKGVPQPKLIDFGIYQELSPGMKRLPSRGKAKVMGTPLFASPEQVRGEDATAKSDVYSAGITLYALVTGRTPFEEQSTLDEICQAHVKQEPRRPSEFVAIPRALEDAIMWAIRKDPGERPDAFSFAETLTALSADLSPRAVARSQGQAIRRGPGAKTEGPARTDPNVPTPGWDDPNDQLANVPETEPGVPQAVLQMWLERAMSGDATREREVQRVDDASPQPEIRLPLFSTLRGEKGDEPMGADQLPHEDSVRTSQELTRSLPEFAAVITPLNGDTPVVPLPEPHDDPDAPAEIRAASIVIIGHADTVRREAADPEQVVLKASQDLRIQLSPASSAAGSSLQPVVAVKTPSEAARASLPRDMPHRGSGEGEPKPVGSVAADATRSAPRPRPAPGSNVEVEGQPEPDGPRAARTPGQAALATPGHRLSVDAGCAARAARSTAQTLKLPPSPIRPAAGSPPAPKRESSTAPWSGLDSKPPARTNESPDRRHEQLRDIEPRAHSDRARRSWMRPPAAFLRANWPVIVAFMFSVLVGLALLSWLGLLSAGR